MVSQTVEVSKQGCTQQFQCLILPAAAAPAAAAASHQHFPAHCLWVPGVQQHLCCQQQQAPLPFRLTQLLLVLQQALSNQRRAFRGE